MPPPEIKRSILTSSARDRLVGQMMPQPALLAGQRSAMLDDFVSCHQWLALGVGVDPVTMLSPRDRSILEALQARFIVVDGKARDERTLAVQCADADFIAWAKQYGVRAILVRPDRFIADRLDPERDLAVLGLFEQAHAGAASKVAA